MVPRDSVLADKTRYYDRWPSRRFALKRETLRVSEFAPNRFDVTFDFTFDVESEARNARSVGRSTMSLGLRRVGGGLRHHVAVRKDFRANTEHEEVSKAIRCHYSSLPGRGWVLRKASRTADFVG
jgi:hypothetical protein